MNRIESKFRELHERKEKGFIAYIGAGDPNLKVTEQLALAFEKVGVDILELGVPFSDPVADGIVNQLSAQRGLASGTTPASVIKTVSEIRKHSQIPIVLYIYLNLALRYGLEKFITDSAQAGIDGILMLDLPPEESAEYDQLMSKAGLCPIYLIAPTTTDNRISLITKKAKGFIYYISREGVTGMQKSLPESLPNMVAKIRRYTSLPIAVGFGISNPDQAKLVARIADAVVVGSAIVNQISKTINQQDLPAKVADYVEGLVKAVK